ncbi:MAG: hypothetical protein ACRC46_00670 [Thermoguttaceae bacterium]
MKRLWLLVVVAFFAVDCAVDGVAGGPVPPPCGCPFMVGVPGAEEQRQLETSGLCPYCLRCCEHIARYGHDPQWMEARPVPIKCGYPGTLGRLGYGHTCGYACYAQHGRCDKPVAYIAPEYVAAINCAVAQQYAAKQAAVAANRADIIALQQGTYCISLSETLAEAENYLAIAEQNQDVCETARLSKEVCTLNATLRAADAKRVALIREAERRDAIYRRATDVATKSRSTANVASHTQHVFVKPPLDKSLLALPDMNEADWK